MQTYDVTARSSAPPERVWSLLTDPATWPTWSPIDALEQDRCESLGPDGRDVVGTVRAFRTGKVRAREQVTELDQPTWFRYRGLENPQMSDYVASIELRPAEEGGTTIRWRGTYAVRLGRRRLFQWFLRRFMQSMVDGLASYASAHPR